jgi:hypothetical protein
MIPQMGQQTASIHHILRRKAAYQAHALAPFFISTLITI